MTCLEFAVWIVPHLASMGIDVLSAAETGDGKLTIVVTDTTWTVELAKGNGSTGGVP